MVSVLRVSVTTPLFIINLFADGDANGYFYLGRPYASIDKILFSFTMCISFVEKLPIHSRLTPFALYALFDFVLCFVMSIHTILIGYYIVPLIGYNPTICILAMNVSLCFKVGHLFITLKLIYSKKSNDDDDNDGQLINVIGGDRSTTSTTMMMTTMAVPDLPPDYEAPPSYADAIRIEERK